MSLSDHQIPECTGTDDTKFLWVIAVMVHGAAAAAAADLHLVYLLSGRYFCSILRTVACASCKVLCPELECRTPFTIKRAV
jgi:hypothetical protein